MAQQTLVVGQITDRQTGEPIPNANLIFRHTNIGTATDEDGFYVLQTSDTTVSIIDITAIGYAPVHFRIKSGRSAALHATLRQQPQTLEQLIVMPTQNEQAFRLMCGAAANTAAHDGDGATTTTLAYLSQLTPQIMQKKLWKRILENIADTTQLVPVYRESQGEVSAALFPATAYRQLLAPATQNIDFTNKTLLIGNRACPNPFATTAKRWYNYYLADSISSDEGKAYIVHFRTKNPYALSLNGEAVIDSATTRLQSIKASIPPTANINLIRRLDLSQTYRGGGITSDDRHMLLDFIQQPDSAHRFFPSLYARTSQTFAETLLPDSMATIDSGAVEDSIIASLNKRPFVRFLAWTATTLITYHMPAGYIDVGDISQIMSFNRQEKFRIGIPLRTSAKLMKDWVIGGYAAYGLRDKGWKYNAYLQYQTPTQLQHLVGAQVTHDYTRIGHHPFQYFMLENRTGRGFADFTTGLLNFMPRTRDYIPHRHVTLYTSHDITRGIEIFSQISIGQTALGQFDEGGFYNYHKWSDFQYFDHHNLLLSMRFSFDDQKLRIHQQRIYLYGKKPVISIGAEFGTYRLPGQSHRAYGRLHASLRQNIAAGMAGNIDYAVQVGRIIGSVPYPLLCTFYGNETYSFDRYRLTLLNDMQYAADTYAELHVLWNMQGLLFNLIPGINRLKLRELVEFKAAYGTMKNNHGDVLQLPYGLSAMKNPYAEAGVGIGNILGVGDVLFVWRLTNRSDKSSPTWGVRFRLHIDL